MTKVLTTQNAQITTATVEVKTLTISGKQVTLAVFRQLREEPLISQGGTLNGVPWGIVNYHPDKCGGLRAHWHVVWQRGAELLRSLVEISPEWCYESEAANEFIAAIAWEAQQEGGTSFFGGKAPQPEYGRRVVHWRANGGIDVKSTVSSRVADVLRYPTRSDYRLDPPARSAREWRDALAVELEAEGARITRHMAVRESLAALPHLFIAV